MRFLSEDLSADAEEAVHTMGAARDGASSVETSLEHSVLDSLCPEGSKGFVALFFGELFDCFFFCNQLVPLRGQHPMFLD